VVLLNVINHMYNFFVLESYKVNVYISIKMHLYETEKRIIINLIKKHGVPEFVKNWDPKKITGNTLNNLWKLVKSYHFHSYISPRPKSITRPKLNWWEKHDHEMPKFFLKSDGIGHFQFFQFIGFNNSVAKRMKIYIKEQLKGLNGIILDFRYHAGGNMWPLVEALSPLLNDSFLISFSKNVNKTNWVVMNTRGNIEYKSKKRFNSSTPNITVPIAVLFGPHTESSGEITAAIFSERKNPLIKSFGKPTGGSLSSNEYFKVSDDMNLWLTSTLFKTVDGNYHIKQKLYPNVRTNKPLHDSMKWLKSQIKRIT
jgi:hypothetical protein